MLSPNTDRIVLLPQDLELIEILGITPAEYRKFCRDCQLNSRLRPGEPTAFLIIPFLIQLVIGVALSLLASLLAPKPKAPKPARLDSRTVDGQDIVSNTRFAPKAGFDGLQNVVELGSLIPLVYAKRETVEGVTYGGVRINTNLLWSQLYSLSGSQMLRAIFLIGEGEITGIDASQFAFGDNLISGYDLQNLDNTAGRVAIYLSREGGRLVSADHIAGRQAASDDGNSENGGGPDVFAVRGINGEWQKDFCYVSKPSTQTQFGIYSPIGNDLALRPSLQVRPNVVAQLKSQGDKGDAIVWCTYESQAMASRNKQNASFSSRSGLVAHNGNATSSGQNIQVAVGDRLTYRLSAGSDVGTTFTVQAEGPAAVEKCTDMAQSVSGRQRGWDDALVIGDQYKIGSALVICIHRSPEDSVFISEADNFPPGGGKEIIVTFQVVSAGTVIFTSNGAIDASGNSGSYHHAGTTISHIFKVAIATFVIQRPAQIIEIGLRSTLGIRMSGMCNFQDALSYTETDGRACWFYAGQTIKKGDLLVTQGVQSGTYSGPEQRYTFFKVGYRVAGTDDAFTLLPQCFGTRSITQQSTYNYLRFEMPTLQRWEFQLTPVSGWEIRHNVASGDLEVLDGKMAGSRTIQGDGVAITYTGESVARGPETFRLPQTCSANPIGVPKSDSESYVDDWGKLAEIFPYDEVQASCDSPEHEVVYVNTITPNIKAPEYEGLAMIGVNLRCNTEFSQLNQFSVYVTEGLNATHLFPEVFKDLLTNSRYGVGEILSSLQIDDKSFVAAAEWTAARRYFFDGGISDKINLRTWGGQHAGYFLLDLLIRNGKFALQPAALFNEVEPITGLFTAGNILEDSFELSYLDQQERQSPRVSVKWREEKQASDTAKKGLFPVLREVTVREAGTLEDAPLEQIDLSDFCTSEIHAIDYAKWLCRTRRLITHSVKFKTTPDQAALDLGKTFKLGMEALSYNQPRNGIITRTGEVVCSEHLADGSYPVLLWDGDTNAIQEVDMVVSAGRSQAHLGSVFCLRDAALSSQTYKVQMLSFDEDGNIEVEATHFPTDEDGFCELTKGWNADNNWQIEGAIGNSDSPIELSPTFSSVTLLGPGTVTTQASAAFTAVVNGPDGSYSYLWEAANATIENPTASSSGITFSTPGKQIISVTVKLDEVVIKKTKEVTVVAVAIAPI